MRKVLKGVVAVVFVACVIALGLCVFDRLKAKDLTGETEEGATFGRSESSAGGIGEQAMLAQIEAEQHLCREHGGDLTFRVSGLKEEELPGGEGLLRFRWAGATVFRVDVIANGDMVRSIISDGQEIDIGDGKRWPFSALHDSAASPVEYEAFREELWPFDIIRHHLFPLTGGHGDLMNWKAYTDIYRIAEETTSGSQLDIRLVFRPVVRFESLSDITFTFDMSETPRLVRSEARDQKPGLPFPRRWETYFREEFAGAVVLGDEGQEQITIASRHSYVEGDENPTTVTSTFVEGRIMEAATEEAQSSWGRIQKPPEDSGDVGEERR